LGRVVSIADNTALSLDYNDGHDDYFYGLCFIVGEEHIPDGNTGALRLFADAPGLETGYKNHAELWVPSALESFKLKLLAESSALETSGELAPIIDGLQNFSYIYKEASTATESNTAILSTPLSTASIPELYIPDYVYNNFTFYKVVKVGANAFKNDSYLQNVILSNNITDILQDAFNSSSLTSITLPANLKSIGASAFANCTELQEVIIPEQVSLIGDTAFVNCTGLSSVTINTTQLTIDTDQLTDFNPNAFTGCTGLTTLTGPLDIVTAIAKQVDNEDTHVHVKNLIVTSGTTVDTLTF